MRRLTFSPNLIHFTVSPCGSSEEEKEKEEEENITSREYAHAAFEVEWPETVIVRATSHSFRSTNDFDSYFFYLFIIVLTFLANPER